MNWQLLFSAKGRFNRAKYWLASLCFWIAAFVLPALAWALANPAGTTASAVIIIVVAIIFCEMLYAMLTVNIRRLHDRDKSGWWVIPFLVLPGFLENPIPGQEGTPLYFVMAGIGVILLFWGFIEIACLRGTVGPNRFGEDPLAIQGAPVNA